MADAIEKQTVTAGPVDASDTDISDDAFDDIDTSDVQDDGSTYGEESTTKESDTESAATDEAEDTEEESDDAVEDEGTETTEVEETEDSNDEETTSKVDAAEQQRLNSEAAQRRIAERQAREEAKAQATQEALDQSYSDAYDQAINAGFDDSQARIQAAQALTLQQLQVDAYNNRVMQVTNKVTADLNAAVTQIPEFKSDNPVVRDAMLRAVDNFEAMHLQKDANGDAIQVTGDMLTFLQNEAETIRKLTGLGAQQQEQAKNTQKKRTLSTPSRTPRQPKIDPDLAAFDKEAASW